MLLLKIFDSRKVLIGISIGAIVCLTLALFGNANISVIAFRRLACRVSHVADRDFAGFEFRV